MPSDWTVGANLQNDNVFNGLYSTAGRKTIAVTRADHVVETSLGLYVENLTRWSDWLRTTAGVRADRYRFDVRSTLAANSGRSADGHRNVVNFVIGEQPVALDLPGVVLLLASDESSFCTGAEYLADGGEIAGLANLIALSRHEV